MPRYFFDLVSDHGRSADEDGSEYADVETAYLDAWQAVLEISFSMLRSRKSPNGHRFEINDAGGRCLMELPFTEVLGTGSRAATPSGRDLLQSVRDTGDRNRRLLDEIAAELATARRAVQETRDLLARARALPSD